MRSLVKICDLNQ